MGIDPAGGINILFESGNNELGIEEFTIDDNLLGTNVAKVRSRTK